MSSNNKVNPRYPQAKEDNGPTEDEGGEGSSSEEVLGDKDDKRKNLFQSIEKDDRFKDQKEDSEDKSLRGNDPAFSHNALFASFSEEYRPRLSARVLISLTKKGEVSNTLLHYIIDHKNPKEFGILKL